MEKYFFWITASVADAAAVTPSGIKKLLASGLSTFFVKGKSVFSNGPRSLPRNLCDCPILCQWVYNNFILADELFAKALGSIETCVLVNNSLCGKFVSSLELPATFDERFKIISVPFFIPGFNLLSCELDNFTFKVFYWVILYLTILLGTLWKI